MNIIGVIIGGVILFIVVMALVFWYFTRTKGSGKKYDFLLYNNDGTIARMIKARVGVDKENKQRKVFIFPDNDTTLTIRAPTFYLDGKPIREITMGDRSQYVYLEGKGIDKEKHLKSSMISEEIALLSSQIIENNREFENPMQKTTAALIIGMAVIALIIMIGNIYATITLVGNSKDMLAVAKENSKTTSGLERVSETNAEVAATNAAILTALTGDLNITRRIS